MSKILHINCDMGESFGSCTIGADETLMPYVDACNIACGFHGGDPVHIEKTIRLAIQKGKEIGAHPSYPDLQGFGRRNMDIPFHELKSIIRFQIASIDGLTRFLGGTITHIKAHGALYNQSMIQEKEALALTDVVEESNPQWTIYAQAGSILSEIAESKGLIVKYEAFADRVYMTDGRLASRTSEGSIIESPEKCWQQVQLLLDNKVISKDGTIIDMPNDTVCIHGDHKNSPVILKFIRDSYHAR